MIDADCEDWLEAENITTTPPEWWRPGLGVRRPEFDAEQVEVLVLFSDSPVKAELFHVDEVSVSEAALVDAEAEVVEVQTSPRNRRKTTVPSEVKSWFLEYAAIQKKSCIWGMVRALN